MDTWHIYPFTNYHDWWSAWQFCKILTFLGPENVKTWPLSTLLVVNVTNPTRLWDRVWSRIVHHLGGIHFTKSLHLQTSAKIFLPLAIIGTSKKTGVWLCIAGFWDLQTTSFEIPWFLGARFFFCAFFFLREVFVSPPFQGESPKKNMGNFHLPKLIWPRGVRSFVSCGPLKSEHFEPQKLMVLFRCFSFSSRCHFQVPYLSFRECRSFILKLGDVPLGFTMFPLIRHIFRWTSRYIFVGKSLDFKTYVKNSAKNCAPGVVAWCFCHLKNNTW